jgi:nucleotide-binding universal stress UspA family protein
MIAFRTVLCPVDFSPATPRQIDLAVDLCRAFGGRLVLHHNRLSFGTGASVGWMWKAGHQGESEAALEARLNACLARVPEGVTAEGLLTEGPVSRAVLAAADSIDADLVVLTAHGTHSDSHASITESVLEHSNRAVIVLHETDAEPRTPRFASPSQEPQVVVAPTDLEPESEGALRLAFDLARALPIEVHLLHLLPNGRGHRGQVSEEDARRRMLNLVPEDVAGRAKLHIEHGDAATGIARAADQLSAACIVMGEHARRPIRGWFSRDTSRDVLHRAHCPVWYVPATPAA